MNSCLAIENAFVPDKFQTERPRKGLKYLGRFPEEPINYIDFLILEIDIRSHFSGIVHVKVRIIIL